MIIEDYGYTDTQILNEISSTEVAEPFKEALLWSENNIFSFDDLLALRKCRKRCW